MVISFITLKLNLLTFGTELFGIWILLFSIWGFGSILDFGLSTSLVKFLAEDYHKTKKINNHLINTSLMFLGLLGLIIVITALLVGYMVYVSNSALVPPTMRQEALIVLLLLGIGFYFKYISIAFQATFEGMNNFVTTSKVTIVYHFMMLVSSVVVFVFDLTLPLLALMYAFSGIVFLIAYIITMFLSFREFALRANYIRKDLIKSIFGYSMSVQLTTVIGAMFDPAIKFVIGMHQGAGVVSLYEIARRFATAASQLFYFAFRILLPKAAILENPEEYKAFLQTKATVNSATGVVYSGAVFGIGSVIVALMIEYYFGYPEAFLIFLLLALPEAINNFGYSVYVFLLGIRQALFLGGIQLFSLVMTLSGIATGFYFFDSILGLFGFVVATFLSNILLLRYAKKVSGISISDYCKHADAFRLTVLLCMMVTTALLIETSILTAVSGAVVLAVATILLQFHNFSFYGKKIIQSLFQGKQV